MESGYPEPVDLTKCGWKIVESKLVCDWESSENETGIREHVALLFRSCSGSSITAYSTCHCSCVKKGSRCGPGCRCKNCCNSINTVANTPSMQQHSQVGLHEIEHEDLLHYELLRMEYGEEVIVGGESDEEDYNLEGKDDECEDQEEPGEPI